MTNYGPSAANDVQVVDALPANVSLVRVTLPSRFPFHTLDNLVLSPHRAGWLSAAEDNRLTMLAELLNAAAAGQPMPSKVDKDLGY